MRFFASIFIAVLLARSPQGWAKLADEDVAKLPAAAAHPINFEKEIKPIIEKSCIQCHGKGRNKGEFALDDRESLLKGGESGTAIVVGKSAESTMIHLVSGLDEDGVMPKKGSRLTADQVGLLRAWIDQGAPWPAEITFKRPEPKNLFPRAIQEPRGPSPHPLDNILAAYVRDHHLPAPEIVSDRLYARRVYLDTVGLLPSAEELHSFLADKRLDKRQRLARQLLSRRAEYADHWLTFWNDLLRNDYRGTGFIDGGRKQITRWLYSALATNMPYDQFVRELIDPRPESDGFVNGIVWRGVVNASQIPPMQAAQNISQVFMGVNLKCASCHDSFINDWTLADAYGLANLYSNDPLEIFQCDKPTGRKAGMKFLYSQLGELQTTTNKAERLHQLADLMTCSKNGRLSRTLVNRVWQRFMGRGLVEPVDDMEQPAWSPEILDWLAEDFAVHHYDIKHLIETIVTSRAYQLVSVTGGERTGKDEIFRGPLVRRMSAEQYLDAMASITGEWKTYPSSAEIDFTGANPSLPFQPDCRWIWNGDTVHSTNDLPPVFFSKQFELAEIPERATAIVGTSSGFTLYLNGAKLLAEGGRKKVRFVDIRPSLRSGTNVFVIRASRPGSTNQTREGVIFHAVMRSGPRNNERFFDVISDPSWLSATNSAEPSPGTFEFKADSIVSDEGDVATPVWSLGKSFAAAESVAMRYGMMRAALVDADPLAVAMGRPNREQVNTTRPSAATTLQAMELTNGKTLTALISRVAAALEKSRSGDCVDRVFQFALDRAPSPEERQLAEETIGKPAHREGVEDFLWAVAMLPEFQLIY
jgi:mono/diheme cytochrome c family protein